MATQPLCGRCDRSPIYGHDSCLKHASCLDHDSKVYVPERCDTCIKFRESQDMTEFLSLNESIKKVRGKGFVWSSHFTN